MFFDAGFVALVAFFMIMGLFQGVLNQIFRLIGLVAVWAYFRFLAEDTAAFIAPRAGFSELTAYLIALIAGVILIYFFFAILGMIVTRLTTAKDAPAKHTNSFLGASLGLLKGLLIAGFIFCVFDILPPRVLRAAPAVQADMQRSLVIRTLDHVNPLSDFRFVVNLAAYADVLKDEKAQRALQDQPPMIELQNNNDVRAVINDTEVQELIKQRKLLRLLALPKVRKLLADPEIRKLLNQIDPQAALDASRDAQPQQ